MQKALSLTIGNSTEEINRLSSIFEGSLGSPENTCLFLSFKTSVSYSDGFMISAN